MIYKGQFDDNCQPYWTEERPKPPDVRHLQAAMFMDRPDLWQGPRRRARRGARPLANQPALMPVQAQAPSPPESNRSNEDAILARHLEHYPRTDEENRLVPAEVRMARHVPHSECERCPLASSDHTEIKKKGDPYNGSANRIS